MKEVSSGLNANSLTVQLDYLLHLRSICRHCVWWQLCSHPHRCYSAYSCVAIPTNAGSATWSELDSQAQRILPRQAGPFVLDELPVMLTSCSMSLAGVLDPVSYLLVYLPAQFASLCTALHLTQWVHCSKTLFHLIDWESVNSYWFRHWDKAYEKSNDKMWENKPYTCMKFSWMYRVNSFSTELGAS